MSVYKLQNAFVATADSAASLDIQFDGIITALQWAIRSDMDADGEAWDAEVSFLSTRTIDSNDSRGSISQMSEMAAGTPGQSYGGNLGLSGLRIPVSAGERIHLHAQLNGTAIVNVTVYLHVEDTSDPRLRRRR